MNQNENGYLVVLKQTLLVLAVSAVIVGASLPIYYLLSGVGIFEWSLLKFSLGCVYGMLLGVGNFLAMSISLVLLTESVVDGKEGKLRAQSSYLLRQVLLVGLAIVGCLIPVFHPIAVLGSLVLTQIAITVYALVGKILLMKKTPPVSTEPSESEKAE